MKRLLLLFGIIAYTHSNAQTTWSEHAAEVFYNNCTSCHHPDGIGTFSLLDYASANAWKSSIAAYVSAGIMPPWTADTSFQHYYDERTLTAYERQTILDWVAEGAIEGDPALAPPAPVYNGAQILPGTPDLTLQMPTYMSKATATSDDYVCISIPSGLLADKKIKAMEVIPGNQQIVHHCLVFLDEDGTYPTDTTSHGCSGPDTGDLVGGYAPGTQPTIFPSGDDWQSGMEMKAGTYVIFAMHYPHGSYGEWDSTKVNFYFYEEPISAFREVFAYPLISDMSFNIPAETIGTVEDDLTMFTDWSFISALPHMHLLGQSIETYGLDAAGDTVPMVRIPKWDFDWQDIFYFEYLQPLYEDEVLYAKGVYDNTSSNPNNPNDPPEDVGWGFDTEDEMFLVYYSFMLYQAGDEYVSTDSLNTIFMSNEYAKQELDNELHVFPNPFEDQVTVSYNLLNESQVNLYIYDTQGRRVRKLLQEKQNAGSQSVIWDGNNDNGTEVAKGLYYFSMRIDGKPYSGRILKK